MPSASAQAALIEATYQKAHLDLSDPCDRPQFFEAHGPLNSLFYISPEFLYRNV